MSQINLKINLPEQLENEARDAGLLTPEAIERLLREALRQQRVDRLFGVMDRLAALDVPVMPPEEIEAEIAAARAVRHASGR